MVKPARRLSFDSETLALFVKLDATPMRRRGSDEFRAAVKELMCRRLGMGDEFWASGGRGVLSRETVNPYPPGSVGRLAGANAFVRCRQVRLALLAAAREQDALDAQSHRRDRGLRAP